MMNKISIMSKLKRFEHSQSLDSFVVLVPLFRMEEFVEIIEKLGVDHNGIEILLFKDYAAIDLYLRLKEYLNIDTNEI